MPIIDEVTLRRIISEEVAYRRALDEGLWDDVKDGARQLLGTISKRVKGLGISDKASEAIGMTQSVPGPVQDVLGAIKAGMAETGESIKLDQTLRAAKQLGQVKTADADAALKGDLEGPVKAKASALQKEGRLQTDLLDQLTEISLDYKRFDRLNESRQLNESGVFGVVGLGLGGFGLVLLTLSGLEKLARFFGAEKTAALIKRAHHTLHKIEMKGIDLLFPNALSFAVYNVLQKRGFEIKTGLKRPLTREEYDENTGGAREKTEKLMYAALLVFFAWDGLKAALHAGTSLLGVAEGTATAVKGVEIAQAAGHLGDLIDLGVETAADVAGD